MRVFLVGTPEGEIHYTSMILMRAMARLFTWQRPLDMREGRFAYLFVPGVTDFEMVERRTLGAGPYRLDCAYAPQNRRWLRWGRVYER